MNVENVVCSFCDARADELRRGSIFNAPKAAICTDCIQVCLEILCERSGIVNFKPTSEGVTELKQ